VFETSNIAANTRSVRESSDPCSSEFIDILIIGVYRRSSAANFFRRRGHRHYTRLPACQLAGLKQVAAYIQQNRHLPGIPSETDVKEKGVSLGEMQSKLLAKVEELTLHMVQAEERNDQLERQNKELQDRIARIEAQSATR
jgi:hypothetical protein